ncbi:Mitochondrial Carrier (MC) Family [Phytophthora palmivora]|uniref:Mitochondrial Carrier (MC) Family n=1 Tax=Phytophthora palmivora TaxID=4796 RepID=A0A2P4X407_9STRA|nr:Mitochondrial Carrier (MC) Family [Phytophthora palmivora]
MLGSEAKCESSELASGELSADVHTNDPSDSGSETAAAQSLAIVTVKNFVSGIMGGGCEAFVGYPLETVKARMQTQQNNSRAFTGPIDCLQKSLQEGGVTSLYRGASPQIFRSAMSASIMFGLMGQYRYFYSKTLFENPDYALIAAGVSTGFTEGMLYTPFEVIKVRMQTLYGGTRTRINNWQCVRDVYSRNGVGGLYRGFWPTAGREMLGNATYFMAYETTKDLMLNRFVHNVSDLSPESVNLRTYQSIAFSGGCAGFMYWLVVFPVDTVARLYRGITPSLIRAFPANAVTFVAFEKTMSFLNQLF